MPKRNYEKVQAKGNVVAEEINIIKNKPSIVLMDNKKDTLRASQKSAKAHPF